MTDDYIINNYVYLQGEVLDSPAFSHTVYEEDFYTFNMRVPRLSGNDDILPVMISAKLCPIEKGSKLALRGQFRSFNKIIEGKSRLILSVFCKEICEWDDDANPNVIELNGYICKPPIFRSTPLSREICDLLLAVNRNYNKSDYIPCIAWGRNAQFVNSMRVGSKLRVIGRIQSREYNKRLEGSNDIVNKVAYEVSISNLAQIIDEDLELNAETSKVKKSVLKNETA